MFASFLTSLGAGLLLAGCATLPATAPTSVLPAGQIAGAVSAADPRAQAAGEAMPAAGGNATDAAIATMLALTVVEPQSSGIGGGGFLVRGTADGSVTTFDGRETAPTGATTDWFLKPDGSLPPFRESVRSGLSVGVPGNIALAAQAHSAHGKLPWAQLFAPAIALARDGFRINPRLHASLGAAKDRAGWSAKGRALFYDGAGNPHPVGHRVVNEELARIFEEVADGGPDGFYEGALGVELAQVVAAATPRTGAMTAADVAGYVAKEREPVCGNYRRHRICTMGPPTSGGIAVIQILGQLERYDLAALGVQNPATWHLFVESQRLAYADRELYLADSDFVSVPVAGLVEPSYLASRSALIAPDARIAAVRAGSPRGAPDALADGDEPAEGGTSHLAAVDGEGTMVSYTSTIEGSFGSGLMVGGFFLNNELTDFSRQPQIDGKPVANRVEGGKRPRSSMAPVVIYDPQGKPLMAVGAAGGATIPVQTARAIIGVIDFGLPLRDALALPFLMSFDDQLMLEKGTWLEGAAQAFRSLGHGKLTVAPAPVKGGGVLYHGGQWESARDPRIEAQLALP